jgi:hypothetical protein
MVEAKSAVDADQSFPCPPYPESRPSNLYLARDCRFEQPKLRCHQVDRQIVLLLVFHDLVDLLFHADVVAVVSQNVFR